VNEFGPAVVFVHTLPKDVSVEADKEAAPQIFGEVMGEIFGLIATGMLAPGRPTGYGLSEGPKVLAEMEARATVGKLALLPAETADSVG